MTPQTTGLCFASLLAACLPETTFAQYGRVSAWGPSEATDCVPCACGCDLIGPPPLIVGQVAAIAAGGFVSGAILESGELVIWGRDLHGETSVPPELPPVTGVAFGGTAAGSHVLAVDHSGAVFAWGWNGAGQASVPANLTAVRSVAAGGEHSVALQADGQIVCWGRNFEGQCNVPSDLGAADAVSAGYVSTAAIRANGTVSCWGANYAGQCDVPTGLIGVTKIDCGDTNVVALRVDGSVVAWGGNHSGQSSVPLGLSEVVDVRAGWGHTVALRQDGSVVQWGSNQYRQFKDFPSSNTRFGGIEVGYFHTIGLLADCNGDGQGDAPQILQGQLVDADSNGVPDICEIDPCPGDINESGVVNGIDLAAILAYWGTDGGKFPRTDANNDGTVDAGDLSIVLAGWGPCPN